MHILTYYNLLLKYLSIGEEKWKYNPNTFNNVDTNNDGLLNATELENYYKTIKPSASPLILYESVDDILTKADINGDGLISEGELALYKSEHDYQMLFLVVHSKQKRPNNLISY